MKLAVLEDRTPLDDLIDSWHRYLKPDKSPRTISTYLESAEQFVRFLKQERLPLDVTKIRTRDVQAFIDHVSATKKPATASIRHRALQQFFKWLVAEEETTETPMKNMRQPKVPMTNVDVVSQDAIRQLVQSVEKGKDFEARRDAAIILAMYDSGGRRQEITDLTCSDIKSIFELGRVTVMGKGQKERDLPFGDRAVKALDRYLRVRGRHPNAREPWLWISSRPSHNGKGRLSANGILQMLARRSEAAGIGRMHPHQFRHSFVDQALRNGATDHEVKTIAGWSSTKMLDRYAAAHAKDRAIAAHRRFSPADAL